MRVEGESAAKWSAIRVDDYTSVEGSSGVLTLADTDTGEVKWKDKTGENKVLSLGAHALRLVSKGR